MDFLRRQIKTIAMEYWKQAIAVFLILLLLLNPTGNAFIKSISSQEFFTYHIKDLIETTFSTETSYEEGQLYLSTGTYESNLEGPLFGVGKGKNLILIQMEALQNMVINKTYNDQEITPYLNQFIQEDGSLYFDNFYQQIGSGNTSDAEFAVNNSLLGTLESFTYKIYENNYFYGLPWIMNENGYDTMVMHGYKKEFWNRESMYPVQGFHRFYSSEDYKSDNIPGIGGGNIVGISDQEFFKQSLEVLKEKEAPFYSFLITLSSHNPYRLPDKLKRIELLPEDEDTLFGNYMASINYADRCFGEFLENLKASGLYENSVIALYGDHFALTKSDKRIESRVSQWLGYPYEFDTMLNVPMMIHIPDSGNSPQTLSLSAGHLDLLPTLSYVMGIERLNTLYLGQNLLQAESGFVAGQTHLLKGSFIKDDIVFEVSRDGVFESSRAWNRITRQPIDIMPLKEYYLRAINVVELSRFYLEKDVIRRIFLNGESIETIMADTGDQEPLSVTVDLYKTKGESGALLPTESKGYILLEDLVREMRIKILRHEEFHPFLVQMEDPVKGLAKFEEEFSGIVRDVGIIREIDTEENEQFKLIKSKLIPVIENLKDYTKVQYLGYERILFMPQKGEYTKAQIRDFVELNRPYGIVVEFEDLKNYAYLKNTDVKIYVLHADTTLEKTYCNIIGTSGYINIKEGKREN